MDAAEVGWTARARAAGCVVWPMGEFTAVRATVHTAIGRRHSRSRAGPAGDAALPVYVPRAHDPALHRDIEQAAAGELRALIVVRGTSSTGKTRSLFEAVHALCPGWTVIRPADAAAARGLAGSGLLDRPVVVWLNELQGFLGPERAGPVGARARRPVRRGDRAGGAGRARCGRTSCAPPPTRGTRRRSDTRELLAEATPWVRWHDVPRTLTTDR